MYILDKHNMVHAKEHLSSQNLDCLRLFMLFKHSEKRAHSTFEDENRKDDHNLFV